MSSIAFVGAGPTTLYALKTLLAHDVRGARITLFEAQDTAGVGTPYRPGWNDPAMLSNIASAEIPPVTETLLGWLQSQPAAELADLGVDIGRIDDRAFVPRVVLGRYFQSQLTVLAERARAAGVRLDIRTGCRVVDAANRPEGLELTIRPPVGAVETTLFDHVVLATGHQWPSRQEVRPGYFASPWPATALADVPATEVGLRGSSLTAIDVAVALAGRHGAFVRRGPQLVYEPAPGTEAFRVTMMSRKGVLPEADFYFPLPHGPLQVFTEAALRARADEGSAGLLDAVFALFKAELQRVDPDYVASVGLADATLEAFGEAYFEARTHTDPFVWAAANLAEARANHAARRTVAWRDAILRMHEVAAVIVPHLDARDFQRFNQHLKPVFVDAYAAVPHESVERMLALHAAGKLRVVALGDDHVIDTRRAEGGAALIEGDQVQHFPIFIEATGQRPLGAIQFPFLSLLEQGVIRDDPAGDPDAASRGILIDDAFHPVAGGLPDDRLFCLSLPFILGRHPFAQGVTSSHQMGETVGRRLAQALARRGDAVDSLKAVA
ncbi:MAG: FAD-dependent oxidoreductase [Brevundimonas sp.]|nr:MAG: FAD-dependent oxidoreductase [Brevundimonas sp.]